MSSQGHKRSLGRQTNRTRFWGRRRVRLGANQQRVTVTSGGNVVGLFWKIAGVQETQKAICLVSIDIS